ncbi:MAG: hypothetical protein II260_03755, partial [Muribaculaceae bacterium]|nr:hypothetical protein [Muribaculaceae bacterium]
NDTWLPRLKKVACWWTTIVVGLFTIQAVWFTYQAKSGEYLNNPELQEQYLENIDLQSKAELLGKEFQKEIFELEAQGLDEAAIQAKAMEIMPKYQKQIEIYQNAIKVFCKDTPEAKALVQQEEMQKQMQQGQAPMGGGEEIIPVDSTAVTPQGQPAEGAADQKATANDKKAEATANENKTNSQK